MERGENKLKEIRHSAEHILMHAMRNLGYKFLMAHGPATNSGFYFDFELKDGNISENDFSKIESEMQKLINLDLPFEKEDISEKHALKMFKENPYKREIIKDIVKENGKISIVRTGKKGEKNCFVDLCAGGHVTSSKEIGAFKLLSIAGAYWKGDEGNKMLTRIYGTAFENKEDLDKYLLELSEGKKRDHRILGKKLDLFTFSPYVGAGLPLYTPKGTLLKNLIYENLIEISKNYGMEIVSIPHLAKLKLYEISGHADKFSDELFIVKSRYNEEFVLKPVNCPHHTQIYASKPRSYRDLPIRYMESTAQHRDEKPGEIGGLTRTRSFTVDDGHIFCKLDQVKGEVEAIAEIIEKFYKALGMWGNHWVSLSLRDPKTPDKYVGDPKDWDKAEKMLGIISNELGLNAKKIEGEAAIYGPKLDYMFKDALGRERQLATIQLDFAMPKRFNLQYINERGEKTTPVMIHRAILGSYERFLALLIEHFSGAFPLWLSPVQIVVIPISKEVNSYAQSISKTLRNSQLRVKTDTGDETMQSKIRKAQEEKIPLMVIVGKREQSEGKISIRSRDGKRENMVDLEGFTKRVRSNIMSRSIEL